MQVKYELRNGFLLVKVGRKTVIKTKTRKLPIESLLNQMSEDERGLAATAIALALFRARNHKKAFEKILSALFEPNKKKVVFSITEYYINIVQLFGKAITIRLATLLRQVLSTLP